MVGPLVLLAWVSDDTQESVLTTHYSATGGCLLNGMRGGRRDQVLFLVLVTCSWVVAKLSEQRRNETNLHPHNGSHTNLYFNQRSEDYFKPKKKERGGGGGERQQKYPFRCPLFFPTVFTNAL